MGKFGSKKSKLSVLSKSWHTWYLEDPDSYLTSVFWISKPKSVFGQIYSEKVKLSIFAENGIQSIMSMLILIPIFVLSNFEPNSLGYWFLFWDQFFETRNMNPFFRQIWVKKSWILHHAWKLVHRISWGCDCKDIEEGLQAKIKLNNCIKCLLLLYLYRSQK